jgi:NNP family nitrate/nitrite transporter-like MFS transporter
MEKLRLFTLSAERCARGQCLYEAGGQYRRKIGLADLGEQGTLAFTVCFAVWTIFSRSSEFRSRKTSDSRHAVRAACRHADPDRLADPARSASGPTSTAGDSSTADDAGAAVATWLLTYAYDYPHLPSGRAGRRHRRRLVRGRRRLRLALVRARQAGHALGIFGAGNVGAAVTKFVAPFVMVAYGWKTSSPDLGGGARVMAVLFWFTTKDDPELRRTPRAGMRSRSRWRPCSSR